MAAVPGRPTALQARLKLALIYLQGKAYPSRIQACRKWCLCFDSSREPYVMRCSRQVYMLQKLAAYVGTRFTKAFHCWTEVSCNESLRFGAFSVVAFMRSANKLRICSERSSDFGLLESFLDSDCCFLGPSSFVQETTVLAGLVPR